MKLKSTMALGAILLVSVSLVKAQQSSAFIRGGLNLANISVTSNGSVNKANMLPSFQVGIIGDVFLAPELSLQPGLLFSGKGAKSQVVNSTTGDNYTSTFNPYYIEIPMNLVFKAPLGQTKFFAGAGPYLGIGVAGKNKIDGTVLGSSFHSEKAIQWTSADPTSNSDGSGFGVIKRYDYGLNATAGIEGKTAILSVNYGLGLAKLQSGTTNGADNNNKNRVLSITVGFKL